MDLFAPASATTAALLGFRVSGLILIAPMFSSRTVPVMVRASLVVLLTILLHPVAMATLTHPVGLTPAALLGEAVVGLSLGLAAALLIGAAEAMGDLLSVQIGISGAASLDPLTQMSVPVLGQFANLFATTLLLSLDGHVVMLRGLARTLELAPVAAPLQLTPGLGEMVALGSTLFTLALSFAGPVIAAILLANVALAVLGRAAPSLNVLGVAFPVQIGLGLLVFSFSIPLIGAFFTGWVGVYEGMVGSVIRTLVGGG